MVSWLTVSFNNVFKLALLSLVFTWSLFLSLSLSSLPFPISVSLVLSLSLSVPPSFSLSSSLSLSLPLSPLLTVIHCIDQADLKLADAPLPLPLRSTHLMGLSASLLTLFCRQHSACLSPLSGLQFINIPVETWSPICAVLSLC